MWLYVAGRGVVLVVLRVGLFILRAFFHALENLTL